MDDQSVSIRSIFNEVQVNLNEAGLRWFTEGDILASLQESYNKIVALLSPIEYSTLIPKQSSPYYQLTQQIPDFMYLSGVYNPDTNLWLEAMTYRMMKSQYQTYLAIGQPKWVTIIDFNRVMFWPFLPQATGVLYLLYKAKAPLITYDHVPILPLSVSRQLLEYFTTADLFEQAREFSKAGIWWNKLYNAAPGQKTIMVQAELEIKALARMDRETVLEPYRWIFHGGTFNVANWINAETPAGTIDGVNASFTLAAVPNPTSSVILTKNGQILYNGVGYTLNGASITYQSGYIPNPSAGTGDPGDLIRAWYQIT